MVQLLRRAIRKLMPGFPGSVSSWALLAAAIARFARARVRSGGRAQATVVSVEDADFLRPLEFNSDVRKGILVDCPASVNFVFPENVTGHRVYFSIALDKLGNLRQIGQHTLELQIQVGTSGGPREYSFTLPIEGPYVGDWTNGIYAYLTKFWADNVLDLGEESSIQSVSIQAAVHDSAGRPLHEVATRSLRACLTPPRPRPVARTPETRKLIIILSFESWMDPLLLAPRATSDPFFEEYVETLKMFEVCAGGISQADWTLPSAGANLLGLYPTQHGFTRPELMKLQFQYDGPSVARIARSGGFLTFAGTYSNKYNPNLGFGAGFDSYEHHPEAVRLLDPLPDSDWIINTLEKFDRDDCFVFVHADYLHAPHHALAGRWARNTPAQFAEVVDRRLRRPEDLYVRNVRKVYDQIFHLIQYLKIARQFDNTMLVLLGDHGHDLDSWYETKNDHPLRESRIRVPYVVHWPQWSPRYARNGKTSDEFKEANVGLLKDVCVVLGQDLPSSLINLPQGQAELADFCFSESLDHPATGDYFLSIRTNIDKYVMKAKIDWDKHQLIRIAGEYLFPVSQEELTLSAKFEAKGSTGAFFHDLAGHFIESNLSFRKEHSPQVVPRR